MSIYLIGVNEEKVATSAAIKKSPSVGLCVKCIRWPFGIPCLVNVYTLERGQNAIDTAGGRSLARRVRDVLALGQGNQRNRVISLRTLASTLNTHHGHRSTPEQKKMMEHLVSGERRGAGGPFNVLLRSPEMGDLAQEFGAQMRFHSSLPRKPNEMAIDRYPLPAGVKPELQPLA